MAGAVLVGPDNLTADTGRIDTPIISEARNPSEGHLKLRLYRPRRDSELGDGMRL